MSGRNIGRALDGLDRGTRQRTRRRDVEEARDWRQGRQERTLAREAWEDPYDEEMSGIKMGAARRGESFDEFKDPYARSAVERGDRTAGQAEKDADFERPYERKGIVRGDVLAEMDLGDRQYEQPFDRRALVRGDESGERENSFDKFNDRYRREGAVRGNQAGEIELENTQDFREVTEADMGHFRRGESSDDYVRQAQNAVGVFQSSGNPQGLEDFYNDMYPDDGQITIKKLPDGTYEGTYGDGTVSIATKEELIEKSEEFFMSHPTVQQGGMGFGRGGGMRGGMGGRGGRGRPGQAGGLRGGTTGKQSAYKEKIYMLAENNIAQGMGQVQAFAEAHREAGYKARTNPEEAAASFFQDILETLMPDPQTFAYKPQEEQERIKDAVWEEAQGYTQKFMDSYHSGYNGGSQGGQEGIGGRQPAPAPAEGGGQGAQPPESAIQYLLANPDQADAFNAKYKQPGLAESYLNGN